MAKKMTLFAIILALLLTACANTAEVEEPTYEWTAEFYEYGLDFSSWFFTSDGEYCYLILPKDNNGNNGYYRWSPNTPEPEKLEFTGAASTAKSSDATPQPDGFGNLYINLGNRITKYDAEGNELFCVDLNEGKDRGNGDIFIDTDFFDPAVDKDGHLFLKGKDVIYTFNTDCTLHSEINYSAKYILSAPDGTVYVTSSDDKTISKLSFDSLEPEPVYENCPIMNSIAAYLDKGFLTEFDGSMYLFNTETMKLEELFIWANLGVNRDDIQSYCVLNDGSIVVFLGKGTAASGGSWAECIYAIVLISQQEASEKEVITLGTFKSSSNLQLAVADFNRYHTDCSIMIKEYYDDRTDNTIGGTGRQDAITKFQLDIASGNCPDILSLEYSDLKNYASKNLFEDLTPYLENSDLIISDNIRESYTFNDTLTALAPTVKLRMFVGKSEDTEEMAGWNLDEMMEYINSHPDETVFDVGPTKMLEYCMKFNQSRFVDWENYSCSFENESFYELLEFCSRFNGDDDYLNTYPAISIAYHNALLYEVYLSTPSDYVVLQQLLNSEGLSFIGFPTDSGSGIVCEEMNGSYAISSASKNKDIAWSFIESLMKAVPMYTIANLVNGYPTDESTRNTYFTQSMLEPYAKRIDEDKNIYYERRALTYDNFTGENAYFYVPLKSEITPLLELLDISEAPKSDSTILDIILENAADYFDEEKSVEEVAKQIQSRVMLYLGEIK